MVASVLHGEIGGLWSLVGLKLAQFELCPCLCQTVMGMEFNGQNLSHV